MNANDIQESIESSTRVWWVDVVDEILLPIVAITIY